MLRTGFDFVSYNIDDIVSINLSSNMLVFGGFNIRYNDWLTYSSGTDRPDELLQPYSDS